MFNLTFKQNFRRSKTSSEKLVKLKHNSYIFIVFFPLLTASLNAV